MLFTTKCTSGVHFNVAKAVVCLWCSLCHHIKQVKKMIYSYISSITWCCQLRSVVSWQSIVFPHPTNWYRELHTYQGISNKVCITGGNSLSGEHATRQSSLKFETCLNIHYNERCCLLLLFVYFVFICYGYVVVQCRYYKISIGNSAQWQPPILKPV